MLKKTRLTSAFINDFVIKCLWWCLCCFVFSLQYRRTLSLAARSAHLHSFGNSEPVIYNVSLVMEVFLLMDSSLHRYDTWVTTQCNKPNTESIHFLVDVVNLFHCRTQPQYQFEGFFYSLSNPDMVALRYFNHCKSHQCLSLLFLFDVFFLFEMQTSGQVEYSISLTKRKRNKHRIGGAGLCEPTKTINISIGS